MKSDKLWEQVRYYNNLSHEFSKIADELTGLAQMLDEDELDK